MLAGLEQFRCPECGREFDPRNPRTYTTKPPFLAWKFWLPGLSMAFIGAAIGAMILLRIGNWGSSLWFAAPFAAGAVLGYRFRSGWLLLIMAALSLTVMLSLGAIMLDIAGVYCGRVLVALFIGPVFTGTALGSMLRVILKMTRFSQRWHLPVLAFLLLPVMCGILEGKPPVHALESVTNVHL